MLKIVCVLLTLASNGTIEETRIDVPSLNECIYGASIINHFNSSSYSYCSIEYET